MKNSRLKYHKIFLFFFILAIFITIALNANKKSVFNWESAYWADAAGYYIYLPAVFIHGFDANNYADTVEAKFGYGFYIDKENNKVITKYTIGLALLTFPFFLIFHLLAYILGFTPDGFSQIYYFMPSVTSPFYLLIGLLFLYKFLKFYVDKASAFFTLLVITLGTNLYYFTFISPYMTHVYSFAVFSFFLFALKKYIQTSYTSLTFLIFVSLSSAVIFLLRPTNLIMLLFIPFLDVATFNQFKERIRNIFKIKKILLFAVIFIITLSPQLIYWNFAYGSFFYDSYENEKFTYLLSPKIIEVIFAPFNGMLLYNPVILLFFIALIVVPFKKYINSTLILFLTVLSLYIISSWGCFFYGCGYGCRPFIEYLSILTLPFAQLIQNSKKIVKSIALLICIYLIYFNLSMIYGVFINTRCFLGEYGGNPEYLEGEYSRMRLWNWHEYGNYIERAKIFPFKKHHYKWTNNFEPDFQDYFLSKNKNTIAFNAAPSGKYVTSTKNEFSDGLYYVKGEKISSSIIKQIDVSVQINAMEVDSGTFLVCQINLADSVYYWNGKKIIDFTDKQNKWVAIHTTFDLPRVEYATYSVYFWSPQKKNILIDDMELDFKY